MKIWKGSTLVTAGGLSLRRRAVQRAQRLHPSTPFDRIRIAGPQHRADSQEGHRSRRLYLGAALRAFRPPRVGPDGNPWVIQLRLDSWIRLPDAPALGLVGRVGSGPWAQVGSGPTTLSGKGELVFAVNEICSQIIRAASRSPCVQESGVSRTRWPASGWATTTMCIAGRQGSPTSPNRGPRTSMAVRRRAWQVRAE